MVNLGCQELTTFMNQKNYLLILLVIWDGLLLYGQTPDHILATSQLGFKANSPKTITLTPKNDQALPDSFAFYIHQAGNNIPRQQKKSGLWAKAPYGYPYDLLRGIYSHVDSTMYDYRGWLRKRESRWGPVWQADFSDFQKIGLFQIETEQAFSLPFSIEANPYGRLMRGYMVYIHSQRSGYSVPGVRNAEHLDDAQLDNGNGFLDVSGGWYNAGDLRKWMSLTLFNLEALYHVFGFGPPSFQKSVIEEIQWGNRYFHGMITEEGQVYEDVGGGNLRAGFSYEDGWWAENHPGCIANNDGNIYTDNLPSTGDERIIRTSYNPFVQLAFVRNQALVSTILPELDASRCLFLAEKAWKYAQLRVHDQRTLFQTIELAAALELWHAGSSLISIDVVERLARQLLSRQDRGGEGLSHYFLEKEEEDVYRSVAFSCLPPATLLRAIEINVLADRKLLEQLKTSVANYLDHFLLEDAKSNPFGLTPYGAFIKKPYADYQVFRDAGRGRGVRTFIHPFNEQFMVHGTNGVVMNQAFLLAKAGTILRNENWKKFAEKLLHWSTGHNPEGLSLFFGIGYKFPVPYSTENLNIPQSGLNGFIGRADDTPYLETSNALLWNTQEIWDIPYQYAVGAAAFLGMDAN